MTQAMVILARGEGVLREDGVAVCVRNSDLTKGIKKFYALSGGACYDPDQDFLPVFNENPNYRRPKEGIKTRYKEQVAKATEVFEKLHEEFKKDAGAEPTVIEKVVEKPVPAPTSGLGNQLEQIMLQVLAAQSVDKVMEIAKPKLEEHIINTFGVLPQIHQIQTPKQTVEIQGVVHEEFDTVLQLVNCDIPVFLTGAAGTGKNVICKQVAEAMGLEFYFTNAVTQEYKLTGFIDANGAYHETQFYKAFTEGGVFMLDEMDASIPEVLIILNAAIANRYFDFPTGRVEAHENFRLIAAGNTFGTGADIEYTGRFQLDAASLDRFAVVEIDYSPAIEDAVANGNKEVLEFVRAFRKACRDCGIKHLATYRAISRMAKLDGLMDTDKILKMALVKGLGKDDIRVISNTMKISQSNRYYNAFTRLA